VPPILKKSKNQANPKWNFKLLTKKTRSKKTHAYVNTKKKRNKENLKKRKWGRRKVGKKSRGEKSRNLHVFFFSFLFSLFSALFPIFVRSIDAIFPQNKTWNPNQIRDFLIDPGFFWLSRIFCLFLAFLLGFFAN